MAFYAFRTTRFSASAPVQFENVTVNEGRSFNTNASSFVAPASGLYWFHLTATSPGNTMCDYRLVGTYHTPNVLRAHTNYNNDTLSRDALLKLEKGQVMYVTSDYPLNPDGLSHSSWVGFSLDSAFDPLVAFVVGRVNPWSVNGLIPFEVILIDTSHSWNRSNNTFVVPQAGVYFFTFLTGVTANNIISTSLRINGQSFVASRLSNNVHTGAETISRSTLALLYQGDMVSVFLESGQLYSDIRYQSSFMGFLYSPPSGIPAISWSVHSSKSVCGPIDPVPFDYILVNEGLCWYSSNRFVTSVEGIFYVNINGMADREGALQMHILHNGVPATALSRAPVRNGYDTRSRSMIIRLAKDDELRVTIPSNACLFSDANRRTSFTGFRLFVSS